MAPGKKGGDKVAATDLKREEKLQAVVLADLCARKLRPATFDGPKALMPLANAPLLEYTLEFLCAGGVEEVFVFASHGAEAIEAYLAAVQPRFAPTALRCIASRAPCFSAGDALREVFEANVIQGEFVLAPGDLVTNLSLTALVAAHRAAREKDKDTLMTTCFTRVPAGHRIRGSDDGAVLVIDSASGRLLHYEPLPDGIVPRAECKAATDDEEGAPAGDEEGAPAPPRFHLPLELLDAVSGSSEVAVRTDLLGTPRSSVGWGGMGVG
ncbi:nucleotide-diphospho-sugar transferase [Pavlovales sp. CCMP2436]|nr:nucleotide-diphospho-sugar transferase [Pavlovales sp. CCMP2436]